MKLEQSMKMKYRMLAFGILALFSAGIQKSWSGQDGVNKAPPADEVLKKYGKKWDDRRFSSLITGPIELNIADSTEKSKWLKKAIEEFQKTEVGKKVKVNRLELGSIEGGMASTQASNAVHVWAPASTIYRDYIVAQGTALSTEPNSLVQSPLVFFMSRRIKDKFIQKNKTISFGAILSALKDPAINWFSDEGGIFKFAHTAPTKSNSGFLTVLAFLQERMGTTGALTLKTLNQAKPELMAFESLADTKQDSSQQLFTDMINQGGTYHMVVTYENIAAQYMARAISSGFDPVIVYPEYNFWSNHPYYILDRPWVSEQHKIAAVALLNFLRSTEMQEKALAIAGFRPGDLDVQMDGETSPFVNPDYIARGLDIKIVGTLKICSAPDPKIVEELQKLLGSGN